MKTDSRKLLQKEFTVGEGSVNVGVNICNIPSKEEDRIEKATDYFLSSVSEILQEISAVPASTPLNTSSIKCADEEITDPQAHRLRECRNLAMKYCIPLETAIEHYDTLSEQDKAERLQGG